MANELKDVLRVNAAEATLDATIRNKQIGMATDTFRLGANFNATLRHYSADEVAATYTAKRTIQLTTDQLRLAYSAGVYSDIGVAADGDLQVTIGATPAVTFDGAVPGQIRIGATAANPEMRGIHKDSTGAGESWANTYYGNYWGTKKTGGVTDVNHRYYSNANYFDFAQSGGVLGNVFINWNNFTQTLGAIGTTGNNRTVYANYNFLDLNAGSIVGSAIGGQDVVDQEAAHTVTGDLYGRYIDVDSDGVVDGSVYGLYINCQSNVDYGIYNNGKSYFGDKVGIGGEPDGTAMLKVTGTSYFGDSVGVGVTPSAWWSSSQQLQVSTRLALSGVAAAGDWLTCNAYQSASGVWTHLVASSSAPVSVTLGGGANAFKFSVNNDGSGGGGTITWRDRFDILIAEAGGFKFYLPTDDLTILDFDIGAVGNGYIKVSNGSVTGYVTIQSTLPTVS